MHRLAVGAFVGFAALAGCLREKVPFCENGAYCPEPLVCTERTEAPFCGRADEVMGCMAQPEETACTLEGAVKGFCKAGICTPCDPNNAACVYEGWVVMPTPVTTDWLSLWVAGPREVYVAGKAGAFIRWDGREWKVLPAPSSGDLRTIAGASASDIWAAAVTSVYHYDGTAWTLSSPSPTNAVQSVWGAGANDFFATGFRASTGRSSGLSWTYIENTGNLGTTTLNAIWGTSSSDVFAVGNAGSVVHWNGTDWQPQSSGTNHVLLAVGGAGSSVFAAGRTTVGNAPTMIRYTGTWADITANLPPELVAPVNLKSVWANAANVFAVGDAGRIVRSVDNGNTWTVMPSNTTAVLNGVSGTASDVFAVGNGGLVLRYRIP